MPKFSTEELTRDGARSLFTMKHGDGRTILVKGSEMSLCLVQSRALLGLEAAAVTVEVHLANGLPSFTLVGLVDVEVREAR